MAMESVLSWNAIFGLAEKTILKSVGTSTQPCLTPFVTSQVSDDSPLSRTLASIPSWNNITMAMNLSGRLYLAMIFYSPSRQIMSNALVKSTNVVKRRWCWSWNLSSSCRAANMSVVPLTLLKPHWLSVRSPCSMCTSRGPRSISIFHAIEMREMPRWLSQHCRLPFVLYIWTLEPSLNSCGTPSALYVVSNG